MSSKYYKWCMVPQCENTSIKTPNKLFLYVPRNKKIRKKWLQLARRDPKGVSLRSSCYFCEDHFDLPNDMENYMQYHVVGSVSKVITKKGCIPTKFECQSDRRKRTSNTAERSYIIKKRRREVIDETLKEFDKLTTVHIKQETEKFPSGSCSDLLKIHENVHAPNKTAAKSVQEFISYKFRSNATPLFKSSTSSLISSSRNLSYIVNRSDSDMSVYKSPVACSAAPLSVLLVPEFLIINERDESKLSIKLEEDSLHDINVVNQTPTQSAIKTEIDIDDDFLTTAIKNIKEEINSEEEHFDATDVDPLKLEGHNVNGSNVEFEERLISETAIDILKKSFSSEQFNIKLETNIVEENFTSESIHF